MKVTTDAVQIFGGYGYTREFPVERFMRTPRSPRSTKARTRSSGVIAQQLLGKS